ncbi:Avirulence (Avh) protein [Phytophthora megakarya]|uniref:RxLR effector protein n=1 Tax=Phytophthora megakarya TaxID=4795 RepID=A0A225UK93_9STRA|nr:Avirulence (Avh) protein [Phytophthora megakarya]
MRFSYVFLLAVATFIAVANKASAISTSKSMVTPELSASTVEFTDGNNGKRHLRAATTVDKDEEERAVSLDIAALKTSLEEAKVINAKWIAELYEVDDVFRFFNLDLVEGSVFTHKDFKYWLSFARDYGKATEAKPEALMLSSLTRKYGDVALANMLQNRIADGSAPIFQKLQKAQFDFWIKNEMGPTYLRTYFFEVSSEDTMGKLGRTILTKYRAYLAQKSPQWATTFIHH